MTAFAMPSRANRERATSQPLPWRRMAWVTWRQNRLALGGVVALLGVLTLGFVVAGHHLQEAYAAAMACRPANSPSCTGSVNAFNGIDNFLTNGLILQAIPALIGAFLGAPVLARELETGSFRFAWTQGFGRWRWALAELASLAVAVTVIGALLSALFNWYYGPYFAAGNASHSLMALNGFSVGLFDLRGVVFAAWALVAFAIGAFAGMLIRRVVPAIVATLVAYAALAFLAGGLLRERYLSPVLTSKLNVPGSAWIIRQWGTKGGKVAWTGALPPVRLLPANCPPRGPQAASAPKPKFEQLLACLPQHGYAVWTSYQPVSRFWSFQLIESGWLLALSLLLIVATAGLVRRRAA